MDKIFSGLFLRGLKSNLLCGKKRHAEACLNLDEDDLGNLGFLFIIHLSGETILLHESTWVI